MAARRLWACLVESPISPVNPALFFQLLYSSSTRCLIAPPDMKALLTESFPTLQPGAISDAAYDCYTQLFQQACPSASAAFLPSSVTTHEHGLFAAMTA